MNKFINTGEKMGYIYETHMHSSEVSGCAIKTAAEQVRIFKQKGYTGVIFTDHFTNGYTNCPRHISWKEKMLFTISGYLNAKREGDKCGLDVFFGWEYTIRGSDFLTYGLDLDFLLSNPDIDYLSIDKYSKLVRDNGGFIAQAHPYKDDYYVEHKFPVDHKYLDAVEVFNPSVSDIVNEKAWYFAEKYDLPMLAGTDSHGRAGKLFSGIELDTKAESIYDIIDDIKNCKVKMILPEWFTI